MKPYNWQEIKNFLDKELRKTKHILTFGTIGSCNIEHDIDLIITKKSSSKTSDFYKEIHILFDSLDIYLKKYKAKSVCFTSQLEEQVLIYLKSQKENDLAFHIMAYISYHQIEIDWAGAPFPTDLNKILSEEYNCLLGSPKDLLTKDFSKKNYYDSAYNFIMYIDKTYSRYPKELYLKIMNKYFDYIFRKRMGLTISIVKNKNQAKNTFYKLCDMLDKLEKEQSH